MTTANNVLYTGKTHTTGGRQGAARSTDGNLDIKLSPPGSGGAGTNPEQLFAAGWSACFIGALNKAAVKLETRLPADLAVDAEVDLCLDDGQYSLQARLNVSLPGVEAGLAQKLIDLAHSTCPYSKMAKGGIRAEVSVA